MNKVVIVGCGNVGMSYAFALAIQPSPVDQLVLIDINKEKAIGEAMDLTHALPYSSHHMTIKAGDYSDCGDADIVCICAGRNQEKGENRRDLVGKNYLVFKDIIEKINKTDFNGIYLVATNPVDAMSYITFKLSKFPSYKVIGSGTTLDSARLRSILGEKLEISPKNIHGYVMGEHGDSEFVSWENVIVGLNHIDDFDISKEEIQKIENEVKNSAYEIIQKKGNTSYGIGMCLVAITNAILEDSNALLSISAYDSECDCFYGRPTILNRRGIEKSIPLELNALEKQKLNQSINTIKALIENLSLD